ncbi:MAG: hypothetical protein IJI44_04315 [Erysipelotrichaceae bacterium]|nr:hypothetical protein [Erysipelotrichaceae bacterium]
MRILRILLLILFLASSVFFGVDQYLSYRDQDKDAPIISCNEDVLHLSVKATDEDLLKGVSAQDERDGDVTKTLVVAGKSNFIEEGVIRVDYAAFDSHNNVGKYSRKVIYDDYHSPRFSSKKPLVLRSESTYDFSFLEAEDVLDGDISNKIKILSDAYTTASSAEYPVVLEVTNNHGDVEKLNVVMDVLTSSEYNRQYPALSDYILYLPVGGEVNYEEYIAGIRQGNRMLDFEDTDFTAEEIMISDYVDYFHEGTYHVVFSLPYSGKITTETKMVVIVTEDY